VVVAALGLAFMPGDDSSESASPGIEPRFLTYDEAVRAGFKTVIDPDLPYCPPATADGYTSEEELAEAIKGKEDQPAVCQLDPHTATYAIDVPARGGQPAKSEERALLHSNAYHFVGWMRDVVAYHGIRGSYQVKNPNVNHGPPSQLGEHVLGRVEAGSAAGNYVEAGWGEFSYYPDQRIAWACYNGNQCQDYLSQYSLCDNCTYPWRVFHCGTPGQNLTCAEVFYSGSWRRLATFTSMRCTNSNSAPNCRIANVVEIFSTDSTPHPSFGGGGEVHSDGQLQASPGSWSSWSTAHPPTNFYAGSPYIRQDLALYTSFKACQTVC